MEYALGFIIAAFIAMTGVGAGTMTTPMLILLLGMPTKQAVGTALIFGAAVKILTTPLYIARKQVNWRAFGILMATGLPGVLIGTLLLQGFKSDLLTAFVGLTIVSIALFNLLRFSNVTRHDRTPWLAAVGLPIGIEVGFSSAGAGALGALCLMNMTLLSPAAIVGTDLSFGLVLSLVGGIIGVGLGIGAAKLLPVIFSEYRTSVTTWSVLVSFLISGMIGIGFGMYPAVMAARMNPIEALRHE